MFFLHLIQITCSRNFTATRANGINRQIGPCLFGNSFLVDMAFVFQNALRCQFTNRIGKLGVGTRKHLVLRFMQHQQLGGTMFRHSGGAVGLVCQKRDFTQQITALNRVAAAIRMRQGDGP